MKAKKCKDSLTTTLDAIPLVFLPLLKKSLVVKGRTTIAPMMFLPMGEIAVIGIFAHHSADTLP